MMVDVRYVIELKLPNKVEKECLHHASSYVGQNTILRPLKVLFTLSLSDQLIQTPFRLLWEALSYTAITVQKLLVHTYPPLSIPNTHLSSWLNWSNMECTKLAKLRNGSRRSQTRILSIESPILLVNANHTFENINKCKNSLLRSMNTSCTTYACCITCEIKLYLHS